MAKQPNFREDKISNLGRFQEERWTVPAAGPDFFFQSEEGRAALIQQGEGKLKASMKSRSPKASSSWTILRRTWILICRFRSANRLKFEAAKNSCQNTCLLPHKSEVIDVSLLHLWVLHDFANFNRDCSFDVILPGFHAIIRHFSNFLISC